TKASSPAVPASCCRPAIGHFHLAPTITLLLHSLILSLSKDEVARWPLGLMLRQAQHEGSFGQRKRGNGWPFPLHRNECGGCATDAAPPKPWCALRRRGESSPCRRSWRRWCGPCRCRHCCPGDTSCRAGAG